MDPDTQRWDDPPGYGTPYDVWRGTRRTLHMLMRFAFQEGEDWLVEVLEPHREQVAAQTAFALAVLKWRYEDRRGGPKESEGNLA